MRDVVFRCEACGGVENKTMGWLAFHDRYACVSCGHANRVARHALTEALEGIEKAFAPLDALVLELAVRGDRRRAA